MIKLSELPKLFQQMTVDEILAIVPDFAQRIEQAETDAGERETKGNTLMQSAETMTKTAQSHIDAAKRMRGSVKRFRKITGMTRS